MQVYCLNRMELAFLGDKDLKKGLGQKQSGNQAFSFETDRFEKPIRHVSV